MKWISFVRRFVLTAILPFLLVMTAIRLLFSPVYFQVEYRMPGFPADPYGFTLEDRLHWSRLSLEYLLNDAGPSFLADLRFPDGNPVFNEREVSHMLDVKIVYQGMETAWLILFILFMALFIWAWKGDWLAEYGRCLITASWITIGAIALILVATVVSFYGLFTLFHQLFFSGESWIFLYSDTLIRMFPLRFWQDAFILMGALTVAGALILLWTGKKLQKRLA